MGRSVTAMALAVVALMPAVTGCASVFTDPRGIDAEQAEAWERAAHAGGGEGARMAADAGAAADAGGQGGGPSDEAAGAFPLLRQAQRATEHPLSDLWGIGAFAIFADGEIVFEWSNRDQLWDEIVVPAGESCRQAGPPIQQPVFDSPEPLLAAVDPYWNNRSTSGRGTLISVMCAYADEQDRPVERYQAVLVATDPSTGRGRVVASGGSWELVTGDYDSVSELVRDRDEAMAAWVRQQDRVETDPVEAVPGAGVDATDSPDADSGAR